MNFVSDNLELIRMIATDNIVLAASLFWILYLAVAVFSLPGAGVMTTTSGAIFGLFTGGLLSATAAWLGAVIIFMAVKYFGTEYFIKKTRGSKAYTGLEARIKRNEFKTMLVVRLTPVIPFFLTNIVAALIPVSNRTYMTTTAIGMVWSFVYAGVGAGAFTLLT